MTDTPNFALVDFTSTDLDNAIVGIPNPLRIICGTPDSYVAFSADPVRGTVDIETEGHEGSITEFSLEEFGLIAALLVNTAEGN